LATVSRFILVIAGLNIILARKFYIKLMSISGYFMVHHMKEQIKKLAVSSKFEKAWMKVTNYKLFLKKVTMHDVNCRNHLFIFGSTDKFQTSKDYNFALLHRMMG